MLLTLIVRGQLEERCGSALVFGGNSPVSEIVPWSVGSHHTSGAQSCTVLVFVNFIEF